MKDHMIKKMWLHWASFSICLDPYQGSDLSHEYDYENMMLYIHISKEFLGWQQCFSLMLRFFFQMMFICVIICSKAQLAPIVQHLKSWIFFAKDKIHIFQTIGMVTMWPFHCNTSLWHVCIRCKVCGWLFKTMVLQLIDIDI